MPSIRIWTLESDNDAKAVKCLANKLATYRKLGATTIYTAGRCNSSGRLRKAIQNYLRQDDCVILVIDRDGPITRHQRLKQPNSLINQAKQIINDPLFDGKVFLVEVVPELEAWLLIDCLGIFCYYATKRAQFKENCRSKVSAKQPFKRLVDRYQRGDTKTIVEPEAGGKGAKEYLVEFSGRVLQELNPKIPRRNVESERYNEAVSPEVAEHIVINEETLSRNKSLKKLGDVIAQFQ